VKQMEEVEVLKAVSQPDQSQTSSAPV